MFINNLINILVKTLFKLTLSFAIKVITNNSFSDLALTSGKVSTYANSSKLSPSLDTPFTLGLSLLLPFRFFCLTFRLRGVRGEPRYRSSNSLSEESVRPLFPVVVDWLEPEELFESGEYWKNTEVSESIRFIK